ncbi:10 kDa chaperonin 5 [Geodia barretti]|uniref:20 kDa chaperonin, chloroplastic n=1 Tax=Geodia barretti TaxID=519541 RepID=A0AA35WY04_GEOBA|nr:10 kDa chaperonin 5 [Geodia barretti]
MAFRPLNDNVLIRRLEVEEEQQGSIIIPDTAKEKPQEGQVLAVGPGRQLGVAVDNKVLFGKYAGTEITIDGEELLVMRESDLLGVVE